jgi:rod shape-determining protein MreD
VTGTNVGRSLLAALLVVTALVIQLTVLAPLPLPLGGTPDLVLLVVISFGLAHGPVTGMAVGFGAGLLVDLAPPSDSPAGLWALVLCVIGHLAGLAADETDRSAIAPLVVVFGLTALAVVAFAGLSSLLGSPRVTWSSLVGVTLSTAAYTVVLAPFVVPLITRLSRRLETDATTRW